MLDSEGLDPSAAPRARWISRAIDFVIVPALFLFALWLPPVSLGERLFGSDSSGVTTGKGTSVAGPAGASLAIPAGAADRNTRVDLAVAMDGDAPLQASRLVAAVATGDTLGLKESSVEVRAAQAAPADAVLHGPLYRLSLRGPEPDEAHLTLPLPEGLVATEATDVLAYDGDAWRHVPSEPAAGGGALVARLEGVPEAVAVAQRVPSRAYVAVSSPEAADVLGAAIVYMGSAAIIDDYAVGGVIPSATQVGDRLAILRASDLSNGILRTDLVGNMLATAENRATHVEALVSAAADAGYAGLELAYAGVDPAQREAYVALAEALVDALHARGLRLVLSMADPATIENPDAYDWAALGRAADIVRLAAPTDPAAYAPGGDMDRLLTWATGLVDRRKLELTIRTEARDVSSAGVTALPYVQALGVLARSLALAAGLAAAGIAPGRIRVTPGLEHIDDLIEDFEQALTAARRAVSATAAD